MGWEIYLTISIASGVGASLLHRTLLKNTMHHTNGYAIVDGFISAIWVFALVAIVGLDTRFDLLPWGNVALAAVLWSATNIWLNKAMKITDASVFAVLFSTRTVWSIAAAYLFLGDRLSGIQIVGAAVIGAAVVMAVFEKGGTWRSKIITFSLMAAVLSGLAIVNDGVVLQDGYEVPSYYVLAFLLPALLTTSISKEGRSSARTLLKSTDLKGIALLSGLHATSAVSLYYAFQDAENLALLLALAQISTILVVVSAIIFLHERKFVARRIAASFVGFAGVLLIVLN